MAFDRKKHWENIYDSKALKDVSWYQSIPQTSLDLIAAANLPLTAQFIDIGGGDSFLVDHLLDLGYQNVTVLDISAQAIARAKKHLGERANQVTWIVSDIAHFEPNQQYDIWHDRAAFHFLTEAVEVNNYAEMVANHLAPNGTLVVGTFSVNGPTKCSGIEISQYSVEALIELFGKELTHTASTIVEHPTPFDTVQEFVFACFKK